MDFCTGDQMGLDVMGWRAVLFALYSVGGGDGRLRDIRHASFSLSPPWRVYALCKLVQESVNR